MKVLWITNNLLLPVCKKINAPEPTRCGWMYSSLQTLKSCTNDLKIAVATVYSGNHFQKYEIESVIYYLIPLKGNKSKYQKKLESSWKKVNDDFQPDLVHLHGTEYAHGLAFLKSCPNVKSVVSIQGLVSVCERYYYAGMSFKDIFMNFVTFNDIVRNKTLWQKDHFKSKGVLEREIIQTAHNIIGRTSWDKVHTWAINPSAKYYFCNETLRDSFYNNEWTYDRCEPHSIFISQAGYPLKGLHQVLKAMPIVLRYFPDTKIYVSGKNILDRSTLFKKIIFTGYGNYINKLIKKLRIEKHVIFVGNTSEADMCKLFLNANLFICPSSIENSPNSLGEAQMLGVPCIASYVGGVPDIMKGYEKWLYRFEEVEMLAKKICDIFSLGKDVSFTNTEAKERHDKKKNAQALFSIYKKIIEERSITDL